MAIDIGWINSVTVKGVVAMQLANLETLSMGIKDLYGRFTFYLELKSREQINRCSLLQNATAEH